MSPHNSSELLLSIQQLSIVVVDSLGIWLRTSYDKYDWLVESGKTAKVATNNLKKIQSGF